MLIHKRHLVYIIIANFAFAILLNSLGNLIFAITLFFILMLWNTPDHFKLIKKSLRDMSLYFMWVILKPTTKILFNGECIPYEELRKKNNILKLEQAGYAITYIVTFYSATIIYLTTREYTHKYIAKILDML